MQCNTYTVIELGKQLSVKEQIRRCREFVGYSIQEDFRAVVFVLLVRALFRLYGNKTHLDDVGSITEKDCLPA